LKDSRASGNGDEPWYLFDFLSKGDNPFKSITARKPEPIDFEKNEALLTFLLTLLLLSERWKGSFQRRFFR